MPTVALTNTAAAIDASIDDALLTAIRGLTGEADKVIKITGEDTAELIPEKDTSFQSLAKAITAAVRTSNVVTVTCTGHGWVTGQVVMVSDLTADFCSPSGGSSITRIDDNSFSYASSGADGAAADQAGFAVACAWTFTTSAPQGASANIGYEWTRQGNRVEGTFWFPYTTPAVGATKLTIELPADMPAPYVPSGLSAANNVISYHAGGMATSLTGTPAATSVRMQKQNSGSKYDFALSASSNTYTTAVVNFSYRAA